MRDLCSNGPVRRTYPGGTVRHVPGYGARNPGTSALEAARSPRPTLLDQEGDLIEESEVVDYGDIQPETASQGTVYVPPSGRPATTTEVVEDLYEQP